MVGEGEGRHITRMPGRFIDCKLLARVPLMRSDMPTVCLNELQHVSK